MALGLFAEQLFKSIFSTDPTTRYEAKHAVLQGLAVRSGFRLYNRNLAWLTDEEFLQAWREFPQTNKNIHERKFNLFQIARGVNNVSGELAECGVFNGSSSLLMLNATAASGKRKAATRVR